MPRRKPKHQVNGELDAQAREAVRVFRSMQPSLSGLASALAGRNLPVVLDTASTGERSSRTDGQKILYTPPITLGDKTPHERRYCHMRGPDGRMMCGACAIREKIQADIYHEIAHNVFGTFREATSAEIATAIDAAVAERGTKYMKAIQERIDSLVGARRLGVMDLGGIISPFLPPIINVLEDARVDENMYRARAGTRIMFRTDYIDIFEKGVSTENGLFRWQEAPVQSQIVIGLFSIGSGLPYVNYLSEEAVTVLHDDEIQDLVKNIASAESSADTFAVAFKVLARFRELGYFKSDKDPEDEPEPQPEPEPEPDQEQPEPEESEEQDGDPADEDQSDELEQADGDESDDSESEQDEADPDTDPEGSLDGSDGQDGPEEESDSSDQPAPEDADDVDDGDGSDGTGEEDDGAGPDDPGSDSDQDESEDSGECGSGSDSGSGSEADESGSGGSEEHSSDGSDDSGERELPSGGHEDDLGGEDSDPVDTDEESDSSQDSDSSTDGEVSEDEEAPSIEGDRSDQGSGSDEEGTPDSDGSGDEESNTEEGELNDGLQTGTDSGTTSGDEAPETSEASDESGESGDERAEADSTPGERDEPGGSEEQQGSEDAGSDSLDPDQDGDDSQGDDSMDRPGDGGSDDSDSDYDSDQVRTDTRGARNEDQPTELSQHRDLGSLEEVLDALQQFSGHAIPDMSESDLDEDSDSFAAGIDEDPEESTEEQTAIKIASMQEMFFDEASGEVLGVTESRYDDGFSAVSRDNNAWGDAGWIDEDADYDIPENILGSALMHMRRAFTDNARASFQKHLPSGKINQRSLGKRAWNNDERLFQKKRLPGKRSYSALIGIDISGSTFGEKLYLAKRAAFAQAELCHRLGIEFSVYAHSARSTLGMGSGYLMDIYEVKSFDEPWAGKQQEALRSLQDCYNNLDGHTIEYYRKKLERRQSTDKILLYYTDGAMPASNRVEETEILLREIQICKQKKITLVGVGIETDSPLEYGLDTVQVDDDSDLIKVVKHLEKAILHVR